MKSSIIINVTQETIWVWDRGQGSDENYPKYGGSNIIRLREAHNSHAAENAMLNVFENQIN